MPTWLVIIEWVLLTASFGLAVYWGVVVFHVVRTMVTVPTLPQALGMPAPARWPSVCVIVPAHNEERGIALLLEALKLQDYPAFRVVFALDRCTDRTAEIVRSAVAGDDRFAVVEISDCPPDWVGKVHAIWAAYHSAPAARDADLLLFLDADTNPRPACLRAAVTLMVHRELQMLSLMSTLTSDEWFERVVQPAACMELMRQYPISRANSREKRRAFANGQFIMITRAAYESIGGHEAVKGDVLEDVYFARHVVAKGHHTGLFLAGDLLVCRMYSTWAAFRRGWLRIFGECANRKPGRLREAAWRLRLTSAFLPACGLAGLGLGAVSWGVWGGALPAALTLQAFAGLAVYFGVVGYVYAAGRTPVRWAPAAIVGAWIAAGVMLRAARDLDRGSPTLWGGKAYQRDVR